MPTISAGMPVLNGEASIARAIEDLLAQSFADFEVVVCDNASDDNSAEIAETYARKDSRVRVIRFDERVDILHSFKRSLDHTDGPYFFFAPVDDRWYPTFMEETLAVLEKEPSLAACHGRIAFKTGGLLAHVSDGTRPLLGTPAENVASYLGDPSNNARAFSLFRREALEGVFPDRAYHGWDYQMVARTFRFGGYQEVPKVLSERDLTSDEDYVLQAEGHIRNPLLRLFPNFRVAIEIWRDPLIPKSLGLLAATLRQQIYTHIWYCKVRKPGWHRFVTRLVDAFRITDDIPQFQPPTGDRT